MSTLLRKFGRDGGGASAIEFACVAPLFLFLLFGIVAFGSVISLNNGLQQLVAEAARASVAGLSDAERDRLARASLSSGVASYAFIDPTRLTVTTDDPTSAAFRVSVRYDMSNLVAYHLVAWLPLPAPVVTRSAVVQRGGF